MLIFSSKYCFFLYREKEKVLESQFKGFMRTTRCQRLPVSGNPPSCLSGQINGEDQLNLNARVDVKPGRHVLPAPVPQVEKRIGGESSQDDEPRRGLQGRAQAKQVAVSAVGCQQCGEAGEGQEHHRRELAEVEQNADVYPRLDEEGHLREEELPAGQHERSQDLSQDHQEQSNDETTVTPDVASILRHLRVLGFAVDA